MQQLGFRSVFAKLFASVMLALILFAIAMVLLTQLVHDKDSTIRSKVLATQILGQIDPFLHELNIAITSDNRLQSRFMLAVIKKSFDIFDESLQAKMGIYDNEGHLLMQTDNSNLPLELPATPSLLSRVFPSLSDSASIHQAQVYSSTGYTLLYESRIAPKKAALSTALNLFTGTLLLLIIMAGVLWWIARNITWRINQMSQQMSQLGDGDFAVRVNARGNDEISTLARGFNQAAQKIEHLVNANNLLLAHASHELRTPITRIRLQIEMMDMLASALPIDTKAKFDKRAQAINRDLSGLNDLVESILLVSRLDAGHAMQQIEPLNLYDLVNQERQHYPEATLIGQHIVIDGQASMLTHLIRNLLTNATLHGVPPVTILLYGVEEMSQAATVPTYLFQSVLDSSFSDYGFLQYSDSIAFDNESEHKSVTTLASSLSIDSDNILTVESADEIVDSSDATIYRNGKTLIFESDTAKDAHHSTYHDSKQDVNHIALKNEVNHSNEDLSVAHSDETTETAGNKWSSSSLVNQDADVVSSYQKLTTDLTEKVKKVVWREAPDQPKSSIEEETDNAALEQPSTEVKISDTDSVSATPRKEGLFKKHLKKAKSETMPLQPKYAVLAVIDEGEGIPENKREEIFSPFVRLQQKNKGSGLGLSLVSQIVTAHQGRITTDTINGHTRFLVVIPIKHDPHYNYNEPNNAD